MAPMAGVRGLLLDLDGVLVLQGKAIPGAQEAMAEIDRRGIPYRVVTNTSLVSRPRALDLGQEPRPADPAGPDHVRPLVQRRLHRPDVPGPVRCSSSPPRTPATSSPARSS